MPRTFTPKDCHAIINAINQQVTGQTDIAATNTSSFVSVGETLLQRGTENVMNAISTLILRTIIASRPYSGKLQLINAADSGVYSNRLRKISFYSQPALGDGSTNNDVTTNLTAGYDNGSNAGVSTASMWEQHPAVPVELNFGGSSVWQDCLTRYEDQLQVAFRNEEEFGAFLSGILTEKENDIEAEKEAFRRMTLMNAMAANHDLGLSYNLTAAYNTFYGLTGSSKKTTAALLTTDLESFLAFLVSEIKILSRKLEYRTTDHHWSPTRDDGLVLLRHTPKAKQKLFLYEPLITRAKAMVLPQIFNDQYLDIKNYEGVDFWQSYDSPMALNVTPAVPGGANGAQIAGSAVNLTHVIGFLFDTEALMVDFQLDNARTTPLEARKHYTNTWYTMRKNAINDMTMKSVLLYMAD